MRFLTPLQRKITKSGLNLSPSFKTILSSDLSIIPQNIKLGYMRITVASPFNTFLCDNIKFCIRDFLRTWVRQLDLLWEIILKGKNPTLYLGTFNTRHYQNAYDSSLIYSSYHQLIEVPKTIFSNNYDRKHFLVILIISNTVDPQITSFHSTFHYNVNEMPQELNSHLSISLW